VLLSTGLRMVQTAEHRHGVWLTLQAPKWSCLFKLFIILERILIYKSTAVIFLSLPLQLFYCLFWEKIHNVHFFWIFLQNFPLQYFLIRPGKRNKTKKMKVIFPKRSGLLFPQNTSNPAFHKGSRCCDLHQLSVVLKTETVHRLVTATKLSGFQPTSHS